MNVILNRPLVSEADCDPFARQRLIPGWDQEKIENARVFVPGVGAIGCAALLNLMLMGFKNLYIADMDRIETSNLSRTPLFRKGDEGQYKAVLAAKRLKELSPLEDVCIDAFTGDITRDLGSGVFRRFDLVLGCLDNDATRYHIDRMCTTFGKPWINAGISELAANLQLYYEKETGVCFACGEDPAKILREVTRNASCGKTASEALKHGKVPTVQVASSMIAAIQVQEAAKFICGQKVDWGTSLYFQGRTNTLEKSRTLPDPNCIHHDYQIADEVTELPGIGVNSTLSELLDAVKDVKGEGDYYLDLGDEEGRDYLRSVPCVYCGKEIPLGIPAHRFRDPMAICPDCRGRTGIPGEPVPDSVRVFGANTPDLLDRTLGQLGLPPLHVLQMRNGATGEIFFVEMTADLPDVLPENFGRENHEGGKESGR